MTSAPEKLSQDEIIDSIGNYAFGWHDEDSAGASARRGLSEDVVRDISARKDEPEWMLERRLKALKLFEKKPLPTWGPDLRGPGCAPHPPRAPCVGERDPPRPARRRR